MNNSDIALNQKIYRNKYLLQNDRGYEPLLEIIENIISQNKYHTIIDFGCGTGKLGKYLHSLPFRKSFNLIGVDISKTILKKAKPFYDQVFVNTKYKLPNIKPDFIIFNSVLEHIYNQNLETLFFDIRKKISKNGSIFITVPNIHSPHLALFGNRALERQTLGHVNLKTPRQWRNFFYHHGFPHTTESFPFTIKHSTEIHYFSGLPILNFLTKSLYHLTTTWPLYSLRDSKFFLIKSQNET